MALFVMVRFGARRGKIEELDSKSAAGHPAWGFNSPLQHQAKSSVIN